MGELSAFDVVVGLIVVIAALAGLARGFVGEIVSLLAWVAGIAAVRLFYTPAQALAVTATGTVAGGAILAFVGLFLVAFIAVRLIGGRVRDGTRNSIIGPFDRLLGFGFGAAKGVIGSALLFLLTTLVFDTIDPGEAPPEWLGRARTAPTLAMVSQALVDFVEERRRVPPDNAGLDDAHRGVDGYDRRQRSALDDLLDEQEKKSPSTPI